MDPAVVPVSSQARIEEPRYPRKPVRRSRNPLAPVQSEFFDRYPLTYGDCYRLAQRTGYSTASVQNWVSGRSPINRRMFEFVFETMILPRYPDVDPVMVEQVRAQARDHSKAPGSPRRSKPRTGQVPTTEEKPMFDPPPAALNGHAPVLDLRAVFTFPFLQAALQQATLTPEERLRLIGELAG